MRTILRIARPFMYGWLGNRLFRNRLGRGFFGMLVGLGISAAYTYLESRDRRDSDYNGGLNDRTYTDGRSTRR